MDEEEDGSSDQDIHQYILTEEDYFGEEDW